MSMDMTGIFCMGPGSVMGTSGFKWAGHDPMADCSTLWFETWGLTSVTRAALACTLVFLLAALSQYLTTSNGCQLQRSKTFTKRRLAYNLALNGGNATTASFYDPELGSCCRQPQPAATEDSAVHPERPEVMASLEAKTMNLSVATYTTASGGIDHPTAAILPPTRSETAPTSVKVDNWTHLGDALMRGVRIFLAYLLMLVVMTYDLTLITSIVGGFMASFFVFGKDTAKVPVSADPCCS
ncbi:hypothetical protein BBJ29_008913 [Phytophthora kernoviae]|uniref:Copper transport protein n=1 Tax=Phytophthora kernoviae TaxID=325452 RepID=A0A3F2RCL4_9STRA|nr:hypothetical protein BBP00_00009460 [Phytophthora kernoviae]RLN60972.1 hypothetical protein BBJ29_008913 [Phytophthora kernoviae]